MERKTARSPWPVHPGVLQGRNVVCGIRDQRGGIRDQKGWIWDHSPGIRDHRPWNRDQQFFFRDQGQGCTIFVGSGTKTSHAFGIKNQKFVYKNGISDEETYLVTTLVLMAISKPLGKSHTKLVPSRNRIGMLRHL